MAGFEAVIHSIISGVFAASAGAAGKLAFDKALISNGCLELQSVFESSELLNWLQTLEFYPDVILHTDVCNSQVGTLLFSFRIMFPISFKPAVISPQIGGQIVYFSSILYISIIFPSYIKQHCLWNLSLIDRSAIFIQEKGFEIIVWIVKVHSSIIFKIKGCNMMLPSNIVLLSYQKNAIARLIHDMRCKMINAHQTLSEKNDIFFRHLNKNTIIKDYVYCINTTDSTGL